MEVDCKYLNIDGDCTLKGKKNVETCEGECLNMVRGWTKEDEIDHREHEKRED